MAGAIRTLMLLAAAHLAALAFGAWVMLSTEAALLLAWPALLLAVMSIQVRALDAALDARDLAATALKHARRLRGMR
jgi:hypothetical protein